MGAPGVIWELWECEKQTLTAKPKKTKKHAVREPIKLKNKHKAAQSHLKGHGGVRLR